MPVSNLDIIKAIVLQEVEGQDTTENKPVDKEFILRKYEGLNTVLEYLMTPSYREYVTDVFIVAPKPTTFKIVLHNGQFFFLQFMGKAYEATVEGKKYYLMTIGEKERCMIAISRLLRFGNPLKTKGPEGAEQGTKGGEEGGEKTPPAETSAPEGGEEGGGEELTEGFFLKEKDNEDEDVTPAGEFEQISVDLWNLALKNKKLPGEYAKHRELYNSIKGIISKIKTQNPLIKFSNQKIRTSKEWIENTGGKSQDEPKTDIMSTNKVLKISVKKGKSQLMSAEKKEAIATFIAAANSLGMSAKAQNKVIQMLNEFASTTRTEKLNTKELSGTPISKLTAVNKKARKIYDEAGKSHKEIANYLNELFSNNKDFERHFIYEAASGFIKFDNNEGTANYILAISDSGNEAVLKDMSKPNSKAIDAMMGRVKVAATMKSGHYKKEGKKAGYAFYSSLRLSLADVMKKTETLKEAYLKEKELNLLTESKVLIYENVAEVIWSWLVNIFNWLKKKIQDVIEVVASGFEEMLSAVEIEPDVDPYIYTGGTYDWM